MIFGICGINNSLNLKIKLQLSTKHACAFETMDCKQSTFPEKNTTWQKQGDFTSNVLLSSEFCVTETSSVLESKKCLSHQISGKSLQAVPFQQFPSHPC